jgi:hypothetical protein
VNLNILRLSLEILGTGWIVLIAIIGICGGSITVKIRNPITRDIDTVTDITIEK